MDALAKEQTHYQRAIDEGVARADRSINEERQLAARRRHEEAAEDDELRVQLKPHKCSYCQAFVIDVSGPRTENAGMISPKIVYFKHVNYAHVRKGAEEKCPLCETIVAQLDRNDSSFEDDTDEDLTCFAYSYGGQGGEFDVDSLSAIYVVSSTRLWTKWANKQYRENLSYACFTTEQDPAGIFNTTRPIVINPASDESFKLIRSWLAECRHGHDLCQHFKTEFRPLRLVQISETSDGLRIRLCEDAVGPPVEYTTLSYCWGGPQAAQTETSNVLARTSAMDIKALPRTLKDAIEVTHRLHISYIWIDSLCIVQDSPEDKARQIALMPQIYSNAALTISSTRALYADEGFLRPRKPTDEPDHTVSLPYILPSTGEMGELTLFRESAVLSDSALMDRGWTFQEHALSPRILDFAGGQTRWLCKEWYVDGWRKHETLNKIWRTRHRLLLMMLGKLTSTQRISFTFPEACHFWENVVEMYTQRALSVATDRPLAIAGLAEVCCDNIGFRHQYVAGLWRSMFPWALFWSMPNRQRRLPRPTKYQGPSWSWTAISGAVHHGQCAKLNGGRIQVKVVDCSTEIEVEEAPFGAVKSGALVVEARTLPAKWLRSDNGAESRSPGDFDEMELLDSLSGDGAVEIRMCPDAHEADWDDPTTASIDVVLVEGGYEPPEFLDSHGAMGFVLRDLRDGFYSRLGIFETMPGARARDTRKDGDAKAATNLWHKYRAIFDERDHEVLVIV
ncbi:uncharacterized protein HMPREF1541_00520 [Cyphellophora europaea CBS 101466]|uniref:Heterokaryon incompatibility domain-containing protein n=1 Tax=Cyphellophora europaea (strain CBS 101466) TaxID=1220924 RepID=W2SC86_CYPE1|nr:uncharacterized protein HMPREF1541_00520 [Cyphellophora europaea CBS 101466]ETN46336.1 hypothetical protein HMPREF1541_00520 [Cyphellophora europaea CBS 101466]